MTIAAKVTAVPDYDPNDLRSSRTRRLQDKVAALELALAHAEDAEAKAAQRAGGWTAAVLSGRVEIAPAPLRPLLACYPAPFVEHDYPPYLRAALDEVQVGCVSTVPRLAIHRELLAWDQNSELPVELRAMLLSIFFPHRDQFNLDLNYPRLRKRIKLPASDPEALHPCLIYAIGLAACSTAGTDLRAFENIFLERCQSQCELALAQVDRLEHFLWASVVLGWYWCRMGKVINAYAISSTVAQWSVACGLHCISDPEAYVKESRLEGNLLGPVYDVAHFSERVNLWWAVFILDRRVALASGFQPLLRSESTPGFISTVWPRSCTEVEKDMSLSGWKRQSINDLFVYGSGCSDVSNDSLLCLRAKAGSLLDRAMYISHIAKTNTLTNDYWTLHLSIQTALDNVLVTLPELTDQREIAPNEEGKDINPSLVLVRAYLHAAVIVLHSIDADPTRNKQSYDRMLRASRMMAADVRLVGNTRFLYSHACLGPTWVAGAEVCLREVRRLVPPGSDASDDVIRKYRSDLDTYVQGLTWLTSHYPGLGTFIERLGDIFQQPPDQNSRNDVGESPNSLSSTYSASTPALSTPSSYTGSVPSNY